ncbi:F-box domain-containing protein [Mycena sanguinolenta]|uniref:F-box domain-containing protein n=1 Tax=Mycena sanguinolenta TaxID=230812 RepID=A0A8H6YEU2_9AGAR|nr:F-box domain-containing protein [Mycena sanguinolenta]
MFSLLCNDVPHLASAALPFTFADPVQEISGRLMRDPETINHVAGEAWKDLRISRTRSGSVPPQGLSLFPSMQLDIVLEVLGYLHPLELIQISRTNKNFHGLLNSAITDLTWRKSFLVEDYPDLPEGRLPQCPSAISGRRWTKLLFGPQTCWECGQSGTDPDYTIWRRVCATCAEGNLLDTMPGYSETHELNSIVHRTRLYMETDEERGRFWRSDGLTIATQYETCTENGGSEAGLHFIEEQRTLVSKNLELSAECHYWAFDICDKDRNTSMYAERHYRITRSVMKRLITEGFDERDVNASSYDISNCETLYRIRRLTSKLWYRTRPYVLPYVIGAQTRRLTQERETRLRLRKKAIIQIALMALRTPVPNLQHAYYAPAVAENPQFSSIRRALQPGLRGPDIAQQCPALPRRLLTPPAVVEAWANEMKTLLVSLLPTREAANPDILDLATSVFRVRKTNARSTDLAIGWEEARAHLHWFQGHTGPPLPGNPMINFDPRGSAVAAQLAMLLGMDPDTATAADMDRADERFCCGTCRLESQGRRRVMGWRECVLHVASSPRSQEEQSWLRLSPIATADVRRREDPDDYSLISAWSCTLCTDYNPSFEIQKYIEDHIRRTHLVETPVKGEHFILFKGSEPPREATRHAFRYGRKCCMLPMQPVRARFSACCQAFPEALYTTPYSGKTFS